MTERIVFMQVEDNMVTFEKEDGSTIIYPQNLVPSCYTEGDIIKVVIHGEDNIQFLELDTAVMDYRRQSLMNKKARLRARARQSTNNV